MRRKADDQKENDWNVNNRTEKEPRGAAETAAPRGSCITGLNDDLFVFVFLADFLHLHCTNF